MECSYFQFDNKYYQQVSGTAMGNPLSPILAEIVMDTLIDNVIKHLPIRITIIRKYVDDLFLTVPKESIEDVLHSFNSYHPKLQFTCEEEKDQQLPYLDMLLIRKQNQTIRTNWYTKSIASGRLLNYRSFHPMSQKMNTTLNFITRVEKLSTEYTTAQKYAIIRSHLRRNDYPTHLINRCWNRYINQNKPPTETTTNEPPQAIEQESPPNRHPQGTSPVHEASTSLIQNNPPSPNKQLMPSSCYISIPYIEGLSSRISKILKRDYSNIKISYTNKNNVGTLLPPIKDTIPPILQYNVIYRINCRDCESTYIGMTTNHLKTRLSGHQSTVNQLEKLLREGYSTADHPISTLREKTALISHCIDEDHRFDLTNTKIVDHSYKRSTLPILEMCHIFNNPTAVNKRTDVDHLNHTYTGILTSLK